MKLFNRKRNTSASAAGGAQAPVYSQPNVSVSMPMYRIIKVRKLWLGFMFTLGMFTQFLLAIYTPEVWNYLYGVIQNFLPVF